MRIRRKPEPQYDGAAEPQPLPELRPEFRAFGPIRTRVVESLDAPGPVVVLLHGFSDTLDTWTGVLRYLQAHGQPAVALDLPGYGAADALDHGRITEQISTFIADVVSHYDRPGEAPVLVGNSLGGFVAILAGDEEADAVSGVVALTPGGFQHSRLLSFAARASRLIGLTPEPIARYAATHVLPRMMVHDAVAGASAVETYLGQFGQRGQFRRVLSTAPRVSAELIHGPRHVPHVTVPVLVLWGQRDRLVPATAALEVASRFPRGKHLILERLGHCPQMEAPDRIGEIIAGFVHDLS